MALKDVSGPFARGKDSWRTVLLNAQIAKNADFNLTFKTSHDGDRKLEMRSRNAGKVLKFLDLHVCVLM